jgi:putative Mg2+ transporter-C (MgtC) family protein
VLIRLLLAALRGSVIGFERERLLWAAGIRTHMVVCVGACLIMIVSAFGFSDSLTFKNVVLDFSRVAAQVVSGIGFWVQARSWHGARSSGASRRRQASGPRPSALRSGRTLLCRWRVDDRHHPDLGRHQADRGGLPGTKSELPSQDRGYKGALTPELLKQALGVRTGQIKRFLVSPNTSGEQVNVLLTKVSSKRTRRNQHGQHHRKKAGRSTLRGLDHRGLDRAQPATH